MDKSRASFMKLAIGCMIYAIFNLQHCTKGAKEEIKFMHLIEAADCHFYIYIYIWEMKKKEKKKKYSNI